MTSCTQRQLMWASAMRMMVRAETRHLWLRFKDKWDQGDDLWGVAGKKNACKHVMTKGVSKMCNLRMTLYSFSIRLIRSKLKRTWRTQHVSSYISGRKFVSILMRFWYLTSARLPDDAMEGAHIFQVAIGKSGEKPERKRLLTANYE